MAIPTSWRSRTVAALSFLALAVPSAAAHAAVSAPAPGIHERSLQPIGYTSISRGGSSTRQVNRTPGHIVPSGPEPDFHTPVTHGSSATIPAPHSSQITAPNGANRGFMGLTELDQYNAGTGAYANTQGPAEPPDQALCTGNGLVIEAVNDALAVYTTTGSRLTAVIPLNQFFRRTPEYIPSNGTYGDFLSDPKCYYDPQSRRWFLTVVELAIDPFSGDFTNRESSVLIAVSTAAVPIAGWALFQLDTTDKDGTPDHAVCPCGADQPLLGADANGIYISTNEFGLPFSNSSFNGAQIYAISKAGLVQAAAPQSRSAYQKLPRVVQYSGLLNTPDNPYYSVQPATATNGAYDTRDDGTEWFLSTLDFAGEGAVKGLAVWSLTNTAALDTPEGEPTLTTELINSESYAIPPAADQPRGPRPLTTTPGICNYFVPFFNMCGAPEEQVDTGDDRMNQVVYNNGSLYGATVTAVKDATRTQRSGIAYFVVRARSGSGAVAPAILKQGYISVDDASMMYPSIAVTAEGQGAIVFSMSGPTIYPSTGFVPFDAVRGAGAISILGRGALPEDGISGYVPGSGGVARWGDYTAAVAASDGSIWMAGEYIPSAPREPFANWGTYVSKYLPTS